MFCNNCRVQIDKNLNKCPLCKTTLNNFHINDKDRLYPIYKNYSSINTKYNLFLYSSIVVSLISLIANILLFNENFWSVFIIGISFYVWFFIKHTIYSKSLLGERIFYNFLVASILLFLFDKVAGNIGWAFNYTIPILVIGIIFSINMIVFIYKFKWKDYFIYHVMFSLICISIFIYYLFSETNITWAWSIAVYFSLGSVIYMSLRHNKKLKTEFIKRLHI